MGTQMEILLKRRRIAELQSQQLSLQIEEAQLEDEVRLLMANQGMTLRSTTDFRGPSENAGHDNEDTIASSEDLFNDRHQAQTEARMVPPNVEVPNRVQQMLSNPLPVQSTSNSSITLHTDLAQSQPIQSIEAPLMEQTSIQQATASIESESPIPTVRQSQLKASQSPILQLSQTLNDGSTVVPAGRVLSEHGNAVATAEIASESLFFPASPTSHTHRSREDVADTEFHNALTSTDRTYENHGFFFPSGVRPNGNVSRNHRSPPGLADSPTRSATVDTSQESLHYTRGTDNRRTTVYGAMTPTHAQHDYQPMFFQPNVAVLSPESRSQFGLPAGEPRIGVTEAKRYSFVNENELHEITEPQPQCREAADAGTPTSIRPSGLGVSTLKRRVEPSIQEERAIPQFFNEDRQRKPDNPSHQNLFKPTTSRKRLSSMTDTDTRPSKKQAGENIRVTTPPLNENKSGGMRKGETKQQNTTKERQQLASRPNSRARSTSQSSQSSAEPDEAEEESDYRGTSSDQSSIDSPNSEQRRRGLASMQQRIKPQITSQPYTLHLQSQPRLTNIDSPPHTSRSLNNAQGQHRMRTASRPYQQQTRSQGTASMSMLTGPYQQPLYRRLTISERSELELRYCARLARFLCDNTCVSDPPLPLCTESLWQRLRRHFRVGDGERPPPNYNPDTVYTNASDFEADVKVMLHHYVVLGHCGEQAQGQGHGRNARVVRCEFEKTGNARVMCWRMRLESILDEKLRHMRLVLRQCEEAYEADDMKGKRACVDAVFDGLRLGD